MSLTITNKTESFTVDQKTAIDLELKLNVTEYGHPWKHIGDILFDYGSSRVRHDVLTVDNHQYEFLKLLMTKNGYQECKGLS